MRSDVRILLVGDPGVGKTSLILSLVSEEFPGEVPPRTEEITIPADVTPERVPTHIVDYSSQEQSEACLLSEIGKAHVVCIVYSLEDRHTIDRVKNYWIQMIRQVGSTSADGLQRPIILVGNKSDLPESNCMEDILPIMNEFSQVETCVECSAKTLKNISEVFYYAQKAVLHPTAPLYISEEKELTPKCAAALTRIFKICDLDNDNILNDRELFQFQRRCFNVPLQPQALEDVKSVVRKHVPGGIDRDGLTKEGFHFLHSLFIQRGRHETTWTVLRKFGYDDNLELTMEYAQPHLRVPIGSTCELTHHGYQFLACLFEKYDSDQDGMLSPTELHNLFSTCPECPWCFQLYNTVCTGAQGWLTFEGYLAQWTMTTYNCVGQTLRLLAYLGYMYDFDSQLSAIHVTREKKYDVAKRKTSRNVFHCLVLGARGVGKTAFLQGLLHRNLNFIATLNKESLSPYTINSVSVYGQEKYLLLHELDFGRGMSDFLSGGDFTCDAVCLLYDVTNPKSFDLVAKVYKRYFESNQDTPVLVVGCKSEQKTVRQEYVVQPNQFCAEHRLPPPEMFTCIDIINSSIYVKVAAMAAYPRFGGFSAMFSHTPSIWLNDCIKSVSKSVKKNSKRKALITGLGIALLFAFAFYNYKRN